MCRPTTHRVRAAARREPSGDVGDRQNGSTRAGQLVAQRLGGRPQRAGVRPGRQHRAGRGGQHDPAHAGEAGRDVRRAGALRARARARAPAPFSPDRSSSWSCGGADDHADVAERLGARRCAAAASSTITWAVLRPAHSASCTCPPSGLDVRASTNTPRPASRRGPDRRVAASRSPGTARASRRRAASGAPIAEVGVRVAVHRGADVAALDVQDGQRRACRPARPAPAPAPRCPRGAVPLEERRLRLEHAPPARPAPRRRSWRTAPARPASSVSPHSASSPGCGSIPTQSAPELRPPPPAAGRRSTAVTPRSRVRAPCAAPACASCSERTPIRPAFIASMPCTAAAAPCTVVMHGTPAATAAERIS